MITDPVWSAARSLSEMKTEMLVEFGNREAVATATRMLPVGW